MDDGGFQPNPHQQAWLDSLSEERRIEATEALESASSACLNLGRHTDRLADLMLQHARGDLAVDLVMSLALQAEALRALSRGDDNRAEELFASATHYRPVGPLKIVIAPEEPGDR